MLANITTRAFSVIFTAVVLGLSVSAVKWQRCGSAPATNVYGAFAGAFGLLAALIGLAAVWIEAIPGVIMAGVDGLSSILLLAGGIAFAVGIRGVDCGSLQNASPGNSKLFDGGYKKVKGGYCLGVAVDNLSAGQIRGRCRQVEADTVFLFLAFLAAAVAAVLCFLSQGGRSSRIGRHSTV